MRVDVGDVLRAQEVAVNLRRQIFFDDETHETLYTSTCGGSRACRRCKNLRGFGERPCTHGGESDGDELLWDVERAFGVMGRLGSTPHACDLFHSRPEPLAQVVTRAARGREVARARKGFGKRARAVQQPKVSMVSLETRAVLTSTGSTYVDQVVHRLGFRAGEPSSSTALVTSVVLVLALCATTEQQDTEVRAC